MKKFIVFSTIFSLALSSFAAAGLVAPPLSGISSGTGGSGGAATNVIMTGARNISIITNIPGGSYTVVDSLTPTFTSVTATSYGAVSATTVTASGIITGNGIGLTNLTAYLEKTNGTEFVTAASLFRVLLTNGNAILRVNGSGSTVFGTSGIFTVNPDGSFSAASFTDDASGNVVATSFTGIHSGNGAALTSIPEGALSLTDITTANVSITKHGFAPKLSNNVNQFLNGTGGWTTPDGSVINNLNAGNITAGTLALARGGTGSSLSAPAFTGMLGYDTTDGNVLFQAFGTGATYDHATHTWNFSGGGGGGTDSPWVADHDGNGFGLINTANITNNNVIQSLSFVGAGTAAGNIVLQTAGGLNATVIGTNDYFFQTNNTTGSSILYTNGQFIVLSKETNNIPLALQFVNGQNTNVFEVANNSTGTKSIVAYLDNQINLWLSGGLRVGATSYFTNATANTVAIFNVDKGLTSVANAGPNTVLHGATPPSYSGVVESDISLVDVTTDNMSITKHGFAPKGDNIPGHFLDSTGNWSAPAGSGTVTASGGALTANAVILGNGTTDLKIDSGINASPSTIILGVAGTTAGKVNFKNNTSGTLTLKAVDGVALGTITATLPATDTFIPSISQVLTITGQTAARTITIPDANFTVARTDAANTFTGHQTIEGVTSTGATGTGNLVFSIAPTITGHPTIEGVTATGATGTGNLVYSSSPTFITPTLGVFTGTRAGIGVAADAAHILTIASGTITTDVRPINITETRNAVGTTFNGIVYTVTDTTSAAGSFLLKILGGASGTTVELSLNKNGNLTINGILNAFNVIASNVGANSLVGTDGTSQLAAYSPSANLTVSGGTVDTIQAIQTSSSPQFAGVNVGHATDTTIARVSAGIISVEGVNVVLTSTTDTLTNKRITARVTTITSSATPAVNSDNCDVVNITALAATITSMTSSLTGTPNNFDQLEFRIKDDGTARAITWGASYVAGPTALPTTTTISKALHVYFEYDSVQTKWVCMSTGSDA